LVSRELSQFQNADLSLCPELHHNNLKGIAIMEQHKRPIKDYLIEPVKIQIDDESLDLATAKDIAKQKAREIAADPMLLAWYDGKTGDYVPKAECGKGDRPPWMIYAESRGGDITIDINDEEYVFIYRSHLT
jgi:hypothetical protein